MKTFFTFLACFYAFHSFAQNKGQKVYVESETSNENVKEIIGEFKQRLSDWNYWILVDKKAEADFSIIVNVQTSKGIRATSWGGTSVDGSVELFDKQSKSIWLSDTYKSSPNGTNGFNSKKAVAKRLVNALQKKYKD